MPTLMGRIKPIPTGQFRSRLESWWAAYLDDEGLEWKYEPMTVPLNHGWTYTPDFVVEVPVPHRGFETIVVELKPNLDQGLADKRLWSLANKVDNICMMVMPADPFCWFGIAAFKDAIWDSEDESLELFIDGVLG